MSLRRTVIVKQSTRRLLSVFMCVTVLTSTAFVSGCSLSRTVGKISSAAEKASGSQVENFNKLIDAEITTLTSDFHSEARKSSLTTA